jgi:hypothetical protein
MLKIKYIPGNFKQANAKPGEVTDDEDDDNHGADIGQHDLTGSPEEQHTLFFIKCKNN